MKYVMRDLQKTEITGEINDGTKYDGTYSDDDFTITQDFLKFEHTIFQKKFGNDRVKIVKYIFAPTRV